MGNPTDSNSVPQGRGQRLGKLVRLGAKIGSNKVKNRVRRALGGTSSGPGASDQAVYETLGELKGAALKIGQTLSMGAGAEAQSVLSRLFSQAPALPFQDISGVIREEFGTSAERVFGTFEPAPFAAASLGQVHRATTRAGEAVAVKVQYPGVQDAVADDLSNLSTLVGTLGLGSNLFDGKNYLREIREELADELNYRHERERLEKFSGYVREWDDFVVPRAYPQYSTQRVLTMSLLEGPTLQRFVESEPDLSAEKRFHVGEQLVRAVFGPFLLHHDEVARVGVGVNDAM
ncbi:MAG: AarF/UbiB family protein, partial [Myxococcota bacterium]